MRGEQITPALFPFPSVRILFGSQIASETIEIGKGLILPIGDEKKEMSLVP